MAKITSSGLEQSVEANGGASLERIDHHSEKKSSRRSTRVALEPPPSLSRRMPPGPSDDFVATDDLFLWMVENFEKFGDIYRATVFGGQVYVVNKPEYCERILRWNWRNFERKGQIVKRIALLLGNGLIASNGDFWASQRRIIQPAFSKHSLSGLIGMIMRINEELLDVWRRAAERQATVNVTHGLSAMVLKITLTAIFGDDYEEAAPHFDILADTAARDLQFAQKFQSAGKIVKQIAERRRLTGASANDFLQVMMQGRDREHGQPMSDAQLVREVMTLIVAGHETTAGLLNWIWYLLSRHPRVRAKLSEELRHAQWDSTPSMDMLSQYVYTRQVIDEALRLYPPLWLMTRRALKDDHLGEYFVPAGTEIYISPYLIQHNPQLWKAPEQFNPERMDAAHRGERHGLELCPFGAGPRNCIGEHFARLEIQLHLMMFARELQLHYDDPRPAEMTTGMNLLSKYDFVMRPEKLTV